MQSAVRGWLVRRRDGKAKRAIRRRLAAAYVAAPLRPERRLGACAARALDSILRCTDTAQVTMASFHVMLQQSAGLHNND